MIIAESQRRRSFIGRLEPGQDLVDSLRDLCIRQRVETGYFFGFGYVREPRVRTFRPEHRRYVRAPEDLEGEFVANAVHGTVSFHQEARELNVTATLAHTESGQITVAELLAAEVVDFEFTILAMDDVRLYRDDDPQTGMRGWVMMEMLDDEPEESASSQAGLAAAAPTASEPAIEIEIGDFLNHPRLGTCEVCDVADEARIAIRLSTGRVVELHRGIIDLKPVDLESEHRTFEVSIRKKP